jgi:hypothetical protein
MKPDKGAREKRSPTITKKPNFKQRRRAMETKFFNKEHEDRVAAAFCRSMTNFMKDWLGAEGDYIGHCWIPQEWFTDLCQLLSGASSIRNLSASDPDLEAQMIDHPMRKILPLHLFSTWRLRAKHRVIELSGKLVLDLWAVGESDVNMIAGITEPSVNVTFNGLFPGLRDFDEVPLREELALLFRVPVEYGRTFMLFDIDGDRYEYREVSRSGAEEAVWRALGGRHQSSQYLPRNLMKGPRGSGLESASGLARQSRSPKRKAGV